MLDPTENEVSKKGQDHKGKQVPLAVCVGVAVIAAVVGALVGGFAFGHKSVGTALQKNTVSEAELDTVMATYTYNGTERQITAKEVIESKDSLMASENENGEYELPTTEDVLSFAREQIISEAATAENIEVKDEDLSKYAERALGSGDFAAIAVSYGLSEDAVKQMLEKSVRIEALRNKVAGNGEGEPAAPEEPEYKTTDDAGKELNEEDRKKAEAEANKRIEKKYADYIISLAGDEWDTSSNAWKSKDGEYASGLAAYEVTAEGASYEAAQAAYGIALARYNHNDATSYNSWIAYTNDLFNKASITLNTMTTAIPS